MFREIEELEALREAEEAAINEAELAAKEAVLAGSLFGDKGLLNEGFLSDNDVASTSNSQVRLQKHILQTSYFEIISDCLSEPTCWR